MQLRTGDGDNLVIEDAPLAAPGAQGAVHRVKSPAKFSHLCVKIFNSSNLTEKEERLRYMVAHVPPNIEGARYRICWPQRLVYDHNGTFVGYAMPLAYADSRLLKTITTPTGLKRHSDWAAKFSWDTADGMSTRVKMLVNLAIPIHQVHVLGCYVIGDLKPDNVLVTENGQVSVIDVDSFQITDPAGRLLYSGTANTPEYVPPESVSSIDGVPLFVSWDTFALAVTCYEVMVGAHPYTGTPVGQYSHCEELDERIKEGLSFLGPNASFVSRLPSLHKRFHQFPPEIQALFRTAFGEGHSNPEKRPTADQWGSSLHAVATASAVKLSKRAKTVRSRIHSRKPPLIASKVVAIYNHLKSSVGNLFYGLRTLSGRLASSLRIPLIFGLVNALLALVISLSVEFGLAPGVSSGQKTSSWMGMAAQAPPQSDGSAFLGLPAQQLPVSDLEDSSAGAGWWVSVFDRLISMLHSSGSHWVHMPGMASMIVALLFGSMTVLIVYWIKRLF